MTTATGQDGGISREARKWAALCHLVALVGLLGNGIGFVVGPVVVWLLKREDDPFIDEQGKESVNFQLTMTIVLLAGVVLLFALIGFLVLPLVGVFATAFPIIAAVKAQHGEHYRYPFVIRFLK